jgi:hypothetical protein
MEATHNHPCTLIITTLQLEIFDFELLFFKRQLTPVAKKRMKQLL